MKHAREDYNERIQDADGLIPEDEPVFLLRGQDIFAPGVVLDWAKNVAKTSRKIEDLDKRAEMLSLAAMAVNQAAEMLYWQIEHESKIPDYDPNLKQG